MADRFLLKSLSSISDEKLERILNVLLEDRLYNARLDDDGTDDEILRELF